MKTKIKEATEQILYIKLNFNRRANPAVRKILYANIRFLRCFKRKYYYEYLDAKGFALQRFFNDIIYSKK